MLICDVIKAYIFHNFPGRKPTDRESGTVREWVRVFLILGVLIVHLKICFCWKLVFQLRQIRLNLTKFCDTFDWSNFQFGSDTVTTVSFSITVPTINQTLKMLISKFKNYIAGTILFQLFFSNTVIYSILTFVRNKRKSERLEISHQTICPTINPEIEINNSKSFISLSNASIIVTNDLLNGACWSRGRPRTLSVLSPYSSEWIIRS